MADKLVEAHLKQTYRFSTATLLGGIGFSKVSWTSIPSKMVQLAKDNFSDILEFRNASEPPPTSGEQAPVVEEMAKEEEKPMEEAATSLSEEEEVKPRRPRKKKDETAEE